MICKLCKTQFSRKSHFDCRRIYCSSLCYTKYWRNYYAQKDGRPPPFEWKKNRTCYYCKKEFLPNTAAQKFCSKKENYQYNIKNGFYRGKGRTWRQKLRLLTIKKYSKGKNECACCLENNIGFLSIDHRNNDGAKHRRDTKTLIYSWLKKNNYPKGFQVLCFNCNLAKGLYGICPHKKTQ